jgi:hypothetical protein
MSLIPQFKNIHVENINCNGAKIALKINGLPESLVKNITIKDSKIISNNLMDVVNCENIILDNTTIITPNKTYNFANEVINK